MKKYSVLLLLVVILLVAGGVYVASQNTTKMSDKETDKMMAGESSNVEKDDSMMREEDSMMQDDDASGDRMMQQSAYVSYEKGILEKTANTKRILFFYANWCPTCKPADANFQANEAKIPDGVSLIRVNYNDTDTDDEEKKLADTYAVTYQHTFVQIDAQGKVVTKWNGGQIDELLSNLK